MIADWSKDNSVDGRYSTSCIRQAMQNAPTDLKIYSSLEEDLQAALQARSARRLTGAVLVTPASLGTSGQTSSGSFLIELLAGLAGLLLACAAVAAVVRRRHTR